MNNRFFFFIAVAAARIHESSRKVDLQLKLDKYQAATGIDNVKKNEIWNQTMDISKFQIETFNLMTFLKYELVNNSRSETADEIVMARYGVSADLGGTLSPVIFDVEYFNLGMMYQTGIFIIMDHGYYRFTIQCYHNQNIDFSKYAQ